MAGYNFKELNKWAYQDPEDVLEARRKQTEQAQKLENYGDFKYLRQQDYDNALNAKLNQGKFSYDLNGDALYQQYKENYINQGKQAMIDAMGQAAAMTGGYGNSYAATVGNQTYQGYLQNLNNIVPQLQQLALDRYNAESNRLSENLSVLGADRSQALSEHELGRNQIKDLLSYYTDDYGNLSQRAIDLYTNQFTANNNKIATENEQGYKAYQDSIANDNAQQQLRLQQDAQKIAELQAGVKRDTEGNIVSVGTPANNTKYKYDDGKLPQHILDKLASIENDHDLEDYLNDLETSNAISSDYAAELYASYAANNTWEDEGGNSWLMIDDGGINGFLGMGALFGNVNDNATAVKRTYTRDKNGNVTGYEDKQYTMEQLYDELVANGMSSSEARKYVNKVQKNVGIA